MAALLVVLRAAGGLVAASVVVATVLSAVRTIVVPRGTRSVLARFTFVTLRRVFDGIARRLGTYEQQDALMAVFAPIGLLLQPVVWLVLVGSSYAVLFFVVDPGRGVRAAIEESGSSLFTLGFVAPTSFGGRWLTFTEAALGLVLVALLLTYLPSIYAAFSRREVMVAKLEVRAGSPPSAITMLTRFHRIGWLPRLDELWREWEDWFEEVQESHRTFSALVFFRSHLAEQSWITSAGCVLDAAAIRASAVDLGRRSPEAELCLRAGFLCLRRIARLLDVEVDDDPQPGDPIAVTRAEFDAALDELAAAGLPIVEDRAAAWTAFAGWRVNYDRALLGLAATVMAPQAPWSSDRSPAFHARFRSPRPKG